MSPVSSKLSSGAAPDATVEFILEFLSEEIPARFQEPAASQLREKVMDGLAAFYPSSSDQGVTDLQRAVTTYVTPRRLTARVVGLPAREPDTRIIVKGPRVGSPSSALEGFLGSQGVPLDACYQESTPKGVFWMVEKHQEGRPITDVVADLTRDILGTFFWPKSMRWGSNPGTWVRPLRNILAMVVHSHDPKVAPTVLDVEWNGIRATARTQGHPILYPDYVEVSSWDSYTTALRDRCVMLDRAEKLACIKEGVKVLAKEAATAGDGLAVAAPERLYHEVAGLVEYPWFLLGRIQEKHRILPREVLETTLRVHQRYFLLAEDSEPQPYFVVVVNMPTDDPRRVDTMRRGYEGVLDARLEDAAFYWRQDRLKPLADYIPLLKHRLLHPDLGTLWQKTHRLTEIMGSTPLVNSAGASATDATVAARLCKADLCTGMVGEFPELQGIIGGYYARHGGEPEVVCQAIAQQYLPQGPDSPCPSSPLGRALSFADKLDTLVAFFAGGLEPTGSKDPFALRRSALGLLRLCREGEYTFPLEPLIVKIRDLLVQQDIIPATKDPGPVVDALLGFLGERFKVMLRDMGYDHKVVACVLDSGWHTSIAGVFHRADALRDFMATDIGQQTLGIYRRVTNILLAIPEAEGLSPEGIPDLKDVFSLNPEALTHPAEQGLMAAIQTVSSSSDYAFHDVSHGTTTSSHHHLAARLLGLSTLVAPIDTFFEALMVQDSDPKKRSNRLWLLTRVHSLFRATAACDDLL